MSTVDPETAPYNWLSSFFSQQYHNYQKIIPFRWSEMGALAWCTRPSSARPGRWSPSRRFCRTSGKKWFNFLLIFFRNQGCGSGSGLKFSQKCWIRIRMKWMRIRNPVRNFTSCQLLTDPCHCHADPGFSKNHYRKTTYVLYLSVLSVRYLYRYCILGCIATKFSYLRKSLPYWGEQILIQIQI